MNIPRILALAAIAGASVFAFGQSGQNVVPLRKNPPVKMLLATSVGHKAATDVVHLSVGIQPGDAAGLQAYADQVSDPGSPVYRQFLSPEEVGNRFGISLPRLQRIQSYLASQGMTIKLVAKNRLTIMADATVSQAEAAFHTTLEKFASQGSPSLSAGEYFSFTTSPQVPANIAADILDISGLESFTRPRHLTPLFPNQIRSVYGLANAFNNGNKGQNRTIAISSFDGFSLSNIPLLTSAFNIPVPSGGAGSNVKVISVSGGDGQNLQATGEADLDIQTILGVAPLCTLLVYDNDVPSNDPNGNDPIGVYTQELDDNKADVISESYGWQYDPTTALQAHNLHLSMTLQGITYMAASGDSGTNLDGYNYPDIDPEVLSIGGTSVTVDQNGNRTSETGWNSDGGSGSGGWIPTTDTFNVRPAWQKTTKFLAQPGVPSVQSVPYHLFPDISLNADPQTGYLIFVGGNENMIGGTSGASPTCAASWAIVEQQLIANGSLKADSHGHFRLGRLQDTIYSWNGEGTEIFDVTQGTNGILPNGSLSNAGPGWDTDTGWGAPIFSGIVGKLSVAAAVTVQALNFSPTQVLGGNTTVATVNLATAAGSAGASIPVTTNSTAASVPSSVTFDPNTLSATFTVTTNPVNATTTVTITAGASGHSKSAKLTVNPAAVSGLTIAPTTVRSGTSAQGTVTLTGQAGPNGATVTLSSNATAAEPPRSVLVPSGATSATFTIATTAVTANKTATITAKFGSASRTAVLTVQADTVQSLGVSASSVIGGSNATLTGTVTLSSPAPAAGVTVTLTSSNTKAATVAASVKVSGGQSSATFAVKHLVVTAVSTTTLTAKVNGTSSTAALTVDPFQVVSLSVSPTTVAGGASSTGAVTLNATPGSSSGSGVKVVLTSSATAAKPPTSVTVAVGKSSATFTIKTTAVKALTTATVKSAVGTSNQTATLTIQAPGLKAISIAPGSVKGSASTHVAGTVSITSIAPAGGLQVFLTSSNTLAATVPASVTIPAGATSASFTVTHKKVTSLIVSTITASLATASGTSTITVTP